MLGFQSKASQLLFFIFILFFIFFLFLFAFSFPFWKTSLVFIRWVTKTYYGSSTGLRSALQSDKRCIASQPIGTIWSAVCELAKGGMFKVEHAETSID